MKIRLTLEPRPLAKPGVYVEKILDGVLKIRYGVGKLYKTFYFDDGHTESFSTEIIKKQLVIYEYPPEKST